MKNKKRCLKCKHHTVYIWGYRDGSMREVISCKDFHHLAEDVENCGFYEEKV